MHKIRAKITEGDIERQAKKAEAELANVKRLQTQLQLQEYARVSAAAARFGLKLTELNDGELLKLFEQYTPSFRSDAVATDGAPEAASADPEIQDKAGKKNGSRPKAEG